MVLVKMVVGALCSVLLVAGAALTFADDNYTIFPTNLEYSTLANAVWLAELGEMPETAITHNGVVISLLHDNAMWLLVAQNIPSDDLWTYVTVPIATNMGLLADYLK